MLKTIFFIPCCILNDLYLCFLTDVVLMTMQRYEKFNRPPKKFSERLDLFSETALFTCPSCIYPPPA